MINRKFMLMGYLQQLCKNCIHCEHKNSIKLLQLLSTRIMGNDRITTETPDRETYISKIILYLNFLIVQLYSFML